MDNVLPNCESYVLDTEQQYFVIPLNDIVLKPCTKSYMTISFRKCDATQGTTFIQTMVIEMIEWLRASANDSIN